MKVCRNVPSRMPVLSQALLALTVIQAMDAGGYEIFSRTRSVDGGVGRGGVVERTRASERDDQLEVGVASALPNGHCAL